MYKNKNTEKNNKYEADENITYTPESFDLWFINNYKSLQGKISYLFKNRLNSDEQTEQLHNLYCNIKTRVIKSGGFTGNTMGYFFAGMRNLLRQYENDRKTKKETLLSNSDPNVEMKDYFYSVKTNRREFINFNDPNFTDLIDNHILQQEHDSQSYHDRNEFLVRCLFKYLDQKYSPVQANIYRHYYLGLQGRKSYKKLSKTLNMKPNYVKNVVCDIKKDISANLILWILENYLNTESE